MSYQLVVTMLLFFNLRSHTILKRNVTACSFQGGQRLAWIRGGSNVEIGEHEPSSPGNSGREVLFPREEETIVQGGEKEEKKKER